MAVADHLAGWLFISLSIAITVAGVSWFLDLGWVLAAGLWLIATTFTALFFAPVEIEN